MPSSGAADAVAPPAAAAAADRARAASRPAGTDTARLLYGVALQRLGQPALGRAAFAAAAALAPNDAEAQVAAAVGRFTKARPARAFSRLGPLAQRVPARAHGPLPPRPPAALVGELERGQAQLRLAVSRRAATGSAEAARFLQSLKGIKAREGEWAERPMAELSGSLTVPHPRNVVQMQLR